METECPRVRNPAARRDRVSATPLISGGYVSVTRQMRRRGAAPDAVSIARSVPPGLVLGLGARDRVRCWRRGHHRHPGAVGAHQLQTARLILHEGRAALHPVPGVAIEDAPDVAKLRLVDMTTDHAVHPALDGLAGERILEAGDEGHRLLDPTLHRRGQTPVPEPEDAAAEVAPAVHRDQPV